MKKSLYKLTVQSELNNNLKTMEVILLAESYIIAETELYNKLSKGGFNMGVFKVLEVENLPYIEC